MKLLEKTQDHRCTAGLTRTDVLVTVASVLLIFGLLLFLLAGLPPRSKRARCGNNLKRVGLAFKMWVGDGGDKYPMQVSTNNFGSLEVLNEVWRTFQIMSNELSDPRILICPADSKRVAANFTNGFGNENISYFIGLDAEESYPEGILAGDRNLTNGQPLQNHVMTITAQTSFGWTSELHNQQGNIGLADGSVQQMANAALRRQVIAAPAATNVFMRLALP